MKKIFEIARWEYIEKVRTKTFIISLIITPILIILFSTIPMLFSQEQNFESTKLIGVINIAGIEFSELNSELSSYKTADNQPEYLLVNIYDPSISISDNKKISDSKVQSGTLFGYVIILKSNKDSLYGEFRSKVLSETKDFYRIEDAIKKVTLKERLKSLNINANVIKSVTDNVIIKNKFINNDKTANENLIALFYKSIIYIVLLTLMIIYSGQLLVRSLLEEKSNRLIEILISSCKPQQLLTGKILGLSALAVTQMIIWLLLGYILLGSNLISVSSLNNLPGIILFFVLGFLFYSSLLVGIGSIVSSEQEAQQITSYLSMILIIPVVIIIPAIQNPDSLLIKFLTYFPFTTSSIMILKLNIGRVTSSELLLTATIMLFSIFIVIKLSSQIFKAGILYYDKMPSLREIKKWILHK